MESSVVGQLRPDQQFSWRTSHEWLSEPTATPFFEQRTVAYRFVLNKSLRLEEADSALTHFFNCTPALRQAVAQHAFNNWERYNEMVGYLDAISTFSIQKKRPDWMEKTLQNCLWLKELTAPERIWEYLTPTEIIITKDRYLRTNDVYIQILCNCAWEEEHGLQIVLRNGKDFWRVGEQDGNLF